MEVAKVFTGWTIDRPNKGGGFKFDAKMHEPGQKIVLGHRIKQNGEKEGLQVLHLLARSPQTAHFISLKLATRFVSDDPPPTLVERMTKSLPEEEWRYSRSAQDDVRLAGILGAGSVSRQGENAIRVCRVGGARKRRAGRRRAATSRHAQQHGHAALRHDAAYGLFNEGRDLGELVRSARPHELCARTGSRKGARGLD